MNKTQQTGYMQLAIQLAQRGGTPFGCVIIQNNEVLAQAHNTVSASHDPTAHGEINAIRQACLKNQSHSLPGTTLFTTGEPCPMCMSAILYAKIPKVIYGSSIATIARFIPQISITSPQVAEQSSQPIELIGPFMEDQCVELLKTFS